MLLCCCGSPSCLLNVSTTLPVLCSGSGGTYGVWESSYGVYTSVSDATTIVVKNSPGATVPNGTSEPAGSYTATVATPAGACVSVPDPSGGSPLSACIYFSPDSITTPITHTCPSDPAHVVACPTMSSWTVACDWQTFATSNDSSCGTQPPPSGTGTTSSGQTFAIPGFVLLDSNGSGLTITGTYNCTVDLCCSAFPGGPITRTHHTLTGSFSISFCNGPYAVYGGVSNIPQISIGCP